MENNDMAHGLNDSSPTIGKIAEALAKAQAEISHAEKDMENTFFKSKYATLAAVLDACKEPLSKNNLAVFQKIQGTTEQMFVETILAHSSGEWMKSSLPLIIIKKDMQGIGLAISYARRYALSAMVGVAQEDDDANGAGQADESNPQKEKVQNIVAAYATEKQINFIKSTAKGLKISDEALVSYLEKSFGINTLLKLKKADVNTVLAKLKDHADVNPA